MLKHPLHKLSKKNRNIVSGLLVCIAAIFAVAEYYKVPAEEIKNFLFTSLLFLVIIMILAVTAVLLLKGLGKLKDILKTQGDKSRL